MCPPQHTHTFLLPSSLPKMLPECGTVKMNVYLLIFLPEKKQSPEEKCDLTQLFYACCKEENTFKTYTCGSTFLLTTYFSGVHVWTAIFHAKHWSLIFTSTVQTTKNKQRLFLGTCKNIPDQSDSPIFLVESVKQNIFAKRFSSLCKLMELFNFPNGQ